MDTTLPQGGTKGRTTRRTLGWLGAGLIAAVALLGPAVTGAAAAPVGEYTVTSVTTTPGSGGAQNSCASFNRTWLTFDNGQVGTGTTTDGVRTVTITVTGSTFTWSSNFPIVALYVHGGSNGGLLFTYSPTPGPTADTGEAMPPTGKDQTAGFSYGLVCYVPVTTTTTSTTDTATSTTGTGTGTTSQCQNSTQVVPTTTTTTVTTTTTEPTTQVVTSVVTAAGSTTTVAGLTQTTTVTETTAAVHNVTLTQTQNMTVPVTITANGQTITSTVTQPVTVTVTGEVAGITGSKTSGSVSGATATLPPTNTGGGTGSGTGTATSLVLLILAAAALTATAFGRLAARVRE